MRVHLVSSVQRDVDGPLRIVRQEGDSCVAGEPCRLQRRRHAPDAQSALDALGKLRHHMPDRRPRSQSDDLPIADIFHGRIRRHFFQRVLIHRI